MARNHFSDSTPIPFWPTDPPPMSVGGAILAAMGVIRPTKPNDGAGRWSIVLVAEPDHHLVANRAAVLDVSQHLNEAGVRHTVHRRPSPHDAWQLVQGPAGYAWPARAEADEDERAADTRRADSGGYVDMRARNDEHRDGQRR